MMTQQSLRSGQCCEESGGVWGITQCMCACSVPQGSGSAFSSQARVLMAVMEAVRDAQIIIGRRIETLVHSVKDENWRKLLPPAGWHWGAASRKERRPRVDEKAEIMQVFNTSSQYRHRRRQLSTQWNVSGSLRRGSVNSRVPLRSSAD